MITGNFQFETFNFPCGETHVKIERLPKSARIVFDYQNDQEIILLALICHTFKVNNVPIELLRIPYVPFSRQDRANEYGECFSLKWFCGLVNSFHARRVEIVDPHSDVVAALIERISVTQQWEVFEPILCMKKDFWLISPDAGALKKISKLAQYVKCAGLVECSKSRDTKTGQITGTNVFADDLRGKDCYIVDDICDGGRTFIEIAKLLKEKRAGKITLLVTHGFFTKGLDVFDGLIDVIHDKKGRVK